jgi:uncharacterized protein (DUF427 family)
MKLPGPDHPITISRHAGRVVVRFGDTVVADSERALALKEANYPLVLYVPREDSRLAHYERSTHATYCPYKGDASYFTLRDGARRSENAVWSYENPYPAMAEIANYVAFYRDKVTIEA